MMDDAKRELVQNWLMRAQHDLAAARKLSTGPDPYLDIAIFHCQQTAEKAVKGLLLFHDQRFGKTHIIEDLVKLAIPYEPHFSDWLSLGELLTPYATEFRYPGDQAEPDQEEFAYALKAAEGFYNFVLSLLPPETHPQ